MKHSVKFILFLAGLLLGMDTLHAQTTVTYDFNASTALNDWTFTVSDPAYVQYALTNSLQGITNTDNFLGMSFVSKSKHSLTMVSTASYSNISNITFDACATDNSKPTFTVSIVASDGTETVLIQDGATKSTFGSTGTKKWARAYSQTVNNLSGQIKFYMYASSSGKYAALDNIIVTYGAGGVTPPPTPQPGQPSNDATLSDLQVNGTTISGFSANPTSYTYTVASGVTAVPTVTAVATKGDSATVNITAATTIPGNTTIVVTAPNGTTTKTYTVQFVQQGSTPIPVPSSDATLSDLKVNNTTITGFSANTTSYTYTIASGVTTIPTVSATATKGDSATVNITQATSLTGTATILVTAPNGTTTKTYTVQFSQAGTTPQPPVPGTTLTLHETEVYESPAISGGYGGTLSVFGGREDEGYYASFDNSNNLSLTTAPVQKSSGITTSLDTYHFKTTDGWLEMETYTSKSNYTMSATDEFQAGSSAVHKLLNNAYYKMHIKGYDQFSFIGKDNNATESKGKHFEVYIDGVKQNMTLSGSAAIRRFDISTGEHVIEVRGVGASNNEFYGFSLRVAYVPKLKHISGNDSSQVVYQTAAIRPVTYYLKNRITDAELNWANGNEATGILLVKRGSDAQGDTLQLQGTASCAVGTYPYTISAKDETGTVITTVTGQFSVGTKVDCTSGSLTTSVFANTAIKPIIFRCYVTDMNNAVFTWTGTPAPGLNYTKDATTHTLTLSGTPTTPGTYNYTVSVLGGNTLEGTITVRDDQPTVYPGKPTLLYLYKEKDTDGLLDYIVTSKKYGYFARPAAAELATTDKYSNFDAIIISEDVDATNQEALDIVRSLQKPVLNMKVFTYSSNRLGWGDPDNGSITNTKATILQSTHEIFNGLSKSELEVISAVEGNKGLMTADITHGGICLATAPKRGDNYDDDGEPQTFIHEVRDRGAKYLSLPIAASSLANLTADGKRLFDNMISYLVSTTTSAVSIPTVQITAFSIDGVQGVIDQNAKTINLTMPAGTNTSALTPVVTLADSKLTTVSPANGETVDFSDSHYGVIYTVSDFVTKVRYTVKVRVATDLEDIQADGLAVLGDQLRNTQGVWVKIYNVSGQLITTTNSDFSFENLPRGLYIIQSENAQLKVLH